MKTTNEGFLVNTLRRLPRHGVKALAAGAVLIAAALPLAVASAAGAAATITSTDLIVSTTAPAGNGTQATGTYFGTGASGTFQICSAAGTLAEDGGNVSLTTNAPGVTFANVAESIDLAVVCPVSGDDLLTANFASTTASQPGSSPYTLTVTDDSSPAPGAVYSGTYTIDYAPTVASLSPTSIPDTAGNTPVNVTFTGTAFESSTAPVITATSEANGTTLVVAAPAVTGTAGTNGTYATGTTLTAAVTPENSVTLQAATPGLYDITVTNTDGGTVTDLAALTIVAAPITNLSPSAFPTPGADTVESTTILGSNFQTNAVVAFSGAGCLGDTTGLTYNTTSPTTIALNFTLLHTATAAECAVTVTNPGGTSSTLAGALGLDEASDVGPTVSATSATTAFTPGSAGTVTFTGTGFSYATGGTLNVGTSSTAAVGATVVNTGINSATSATFVVTIPSDINNTVAGADNVLFANHTGTSDFPSALSVAGPAITSQTPTTIPLNAPVGTAYTLNGTGFLPTLVAGSAGVVAHGATGFTANINYVSATAVNLIVTHDSSVVPAAGNSATVTIQESGINGTGSAESAPFSLSFAAGPVISGITYALGTTGVGVGAVAQTITINGSNFLAGATVGTFVTAASVADPNVTAKVLTVNPTGTAMTVAISVAAGDTSTSDGYTVTNTTGGATSVTGFSVASLLIQPAPTITSVSPATASANATTAFTITGTGFGAGATVAASADGTCGAATVVSSTSVTVSCTFGAATAAATLVVTNANGGTAASATVLAAGATSAGGAARATSVGGHALVGKTVRIVVNGVNFYGQPKVTSTGKGIKAVVSHDTGTLLTVVITVSATTGAGEHTLTFTLANGKQFKANYAIKK